MQDLTELFHLIADLTYAWEYWIDPDGHFRYASPSCARITGYGPDEFVADPDLLLRITHPDDREQLKAHQQNCDAGTERSLDFRIITRDGGERWIGHVCVPVYASDGTWLGYRASNRDITQLVEARYAAERRASELAAVFDALSDGVIVFDAAGVPVRANAAAIAALGFDPVQVEPTRPDRGISIRHPDGRPAGIEEMTTHRVLQGERVAEQPFILTNVEGEERFVLASGSPLLHGGDVAGAVVAWHDVTEHERAERALHDSEDLLNRTQAMAHVGSWRLDLARDELYWSDEVFRIFGLEPQQFGASYEAFLAAVHPDDREMVHTAYQRAVQTRQPYDVVHRVLRPDGTVHIVQEKSEDVFDESGNVVLSMGMVHDITERRQTEEALKQLAQFPGENPNPVLRVATDGALLYANSPARDWLATLGWHADEPLPAPVHDMVVDACGHDHGIEREVSNSAGRTFWLSAVQPAGEEYVNLYGRDTTELRRAREELEDRVFERTRELTERTIELQQANESLRAAQAELRARNEELIAAQEQIEQERRRYQELFDLAPDGYLVTDQDGVVVETNHAAGVLLGVPAHELPGERLDRFVFAADRSAFDDYLHRLRTVRRDSSYRWEMRLQPVDGDVVHVSVAATVSSTMNGHVDGARWLVRDITQEKQVHAALMHAEQLSLAGQLAASLAHEIKNPLAAAVGCVDLVSEAIEEGADPRQLLGVIRGSLGRASRVVSQLQELHSRSEMEEKQVADLNGLVEAVLLLAGKKARSAGVEIAWKRIENLPTLPLMIDGMQQVFLNLVFNAIEAMPDGGRLAVRARRAVRPARVGIEFADSGPGISPEIRDRLFKPFQTTKAKGSGLGLFISQNIVQQHGGSIEVETVEGKGTTFTVWLPV